MVRAFEEIQTDRLLLRKLCRTDAECYFTRLGGCEEVTRYMLWKPHKSLEESRESIEKVLRSYQERPCYCWAKTIGTGASARRLCGPFLRLHWKSCRCSASLPTTCAQISVQEKPCKRRACIM